MPSPWMTTCLRVPSGPWSVTCGAVTTRVSFSVYVPGVSWITTCPPQRFAVTTARSRPAVLWTRTMRWRGGAEQLADRSAAAQSAAMFLAWNRRCAADRADGGGSVADKVRRLRQGMLTSWARARKTASRASRCQAADGVLGVVITVRDRGRGECRRLAIGIRSPAREDLPQAAAAADQSARGPWPGRRAVGLMHTRYRALASRIAGGGPQTARSTSS